MTFKQAKNKWHKRELIILGSKYKILFITDDYLDKKGLFAEINYGDKIIFVDENVFNKKNFDNCYLMQLKLSIRHEIIHGFMEESGLNRNVGQCAEHWVQNEDCVQWLAMQSPKIFKLFKELEIDNE